MKLIISSKANFVSLFWEEKDKKIKWYTASDKPPDHCKDHKKQYHDKSIENPKIAFMKVSFSDRFDNVKSLNLHIIPDPPHLIKNLWSHFRTKDIKFILDGRIQTAKFQHVKMLYACDNVKRLGDFSVNR